MFSSCLGRQDQTLEDWSGYPNGLIQQKDSFKRSNSTPLTSWEISLIKVNGQLKCDACALRLACKTNKYLYKQKKRERERLKLFLSVEIHQRAQDGNQAPSLNPIAPNLCRGLCKVASVWTLLMNSILCQIYLLWRLQTVAELLRPLGAGRGCILRESPWEQICIFSFSLLSQFSLEKCTRLHVWVSMWVDICYTWLYVCNVSTECVSAWRRQERLYVTAYALHTIYVNAPYLNPHIYINTHTHCPHLPTLMSAV